ncbi:MAG TPA: ABC transporter permease [Blastocatellia bacterium]|nr:ABC transporter permease [Blastocatellia bacterium]
MKLVEGIRLAISTIAAHKLRSFLTLIGVIFGVATVIAVVSIIEGFNRYVDEKIADLGSNAFVVNKLGMITSFQEYMDRSKHNKDIKLDDLKAILDHPVYVQDAAAIARHSGEIKYETKTLTDFSIRGVSDNLIDFDTMKVGQGRYLSREEVLHSQNACFVGYNVADQLVGNADPIGREIKVEGLPFRIVGVAEQIGTVFGNPQDNFVLMPITTYQKIYGSRDSISIKVEATGPEVINQAQDEVRLVLRTRRHVKYDDPDNFGIITSDAINHLREQVFGTISVVAVGVTSISLVVGGIVIMNMMLVSVTERTREIGIRKSLGARRQDILKQFLAESTFLSLAGGAVGVLAAYMLGRLMHSLFSLPISLPIAWTLIALLVSGSIGLFFGIYPAWKAAKLDPIEALRAD